MKMVRTLALLAFSTLLLPGCTDNPGTRSEPVEVSGKVTLPTGKPAKNVTLQFIPTTQATLQTGFSLKDDGTFSGKMIPGKYRYHFEAGKDEAAFKAIPEGFQSTTNDHTVEVKAGSPVDISLGG